jgi:tetraacyldisaccharide 4'-kinase
VEGIDLKTQKIIQLDAIRGQVICTLCSIGCPEGFEKTLEKLGARIERRFRFPDHYVYQAQDIKAVSDFCREHRIESVFTTHKDAVKLKELAGQLDPGLKVFDLRIHLNVIEGKGEILERIHRLS